MVASGVLSSIFCGISQFWPVRLMALSSPSKEDRSSGERYCRSGRKRISRATCLLLAVVPQWIQSALGYPVCTSIGRSMSSDVQHSPTKPDGKGSKRKQDDLDEDDELEQHSWIEALAQELTDEDQSVDPDYEPSTVETDSDEYRSHNNTETDIEVENGVVVVQDLELKQETPLTEV